MKKLKIQSKINVLLVFISLKTKLDNKVDYYDYYTESPTYDSHTRDVV